MQPQAFYQIVAEDFAAVDSIIKQQLSSRIPLVEKIGDYIISAGGKRLRPLLVLLAGNAVGKQSFYTLQRSCTMMSLINPTCVAAARLQMQNGAMLPAS